MTEALQQWKKMAGKGDGVSEDPKAASHGQFLQKIPLSCSWDSILPFIYFFLGSVLLGVIVLVQSLYCRW